MHWIGQVAQKAGVPNAEQLRLPLHQLERHDIWRVAARQLGITEADVLSAAAAHFRLPIADLGRADPVARTMIPEKIARQHLVFPIEVQYKQLVVATADPLDFDAEQAIGFTAGRSAVFQLATPTAILDAIERGYGGAPERRSRTEGRGGDAEWGVEQRVGPAGPEPSPEPDAAPRPAARKPAAAAPVGARTILVVDDDPESRLYARAILAKEGHTVLEAGDGAAGLERLNGGGIDLAVVDLTMPELDGRGLLARIRGAAPLSKLPVIIMTASKSSSDELLLLREGADDYIRKPIDPPLFAARVAAVLRRASV